MSTNSSISQKSRRSLTSVSTLMAGTNIFFPTVSYCSKPHNKNLCLVFQPLKTPTLESQSGNPAPLSSTWLTNTTPRRRYPTNPSLRYIILSNGFISRFLARALTSAKPSGSTKAMPKESHRLSNAIGMRRNG